MGCKLEDINIDILKRAKFEKNLINKMKLTLLTITVKYPNFNRDNYLTNSIIEKMDAIVTDIFQYDLVMKISRITNEGPVVTIMLNKDAEEVKKVSIDIEEKHMLGRCIDISVYDSKIKLITRKKLGYKDAKCIICDKYMETCIKEKTHTNEEIIETMREKYREYIESFYQSGNSL